MFSDLSATARRGRGTWVDLHPTSYKTAQWGPVLSGIIWKRLWALSGSRS